MRKITNLTKIIALFLFTVSVYGYEITIEDAINIASEKNKDILLKKISNENGIIDYENAKKERLPNINWSTSYDIKNEYTSHGISLNKKIFDAWKVKNNIKKSETKNNLNLIEEKTLSKQIKNEIIKNYMESVKYQNQINIYEKSLIRLKKQYEQDILLYEKKMVSKSDILKLEINISEMEKEIINSQNNFQNSLNKLKNTIGISINEKIELKEKIEDFDIDINLEKDFQEINQKSEIIAENLKLKNIEIEKDIAKADFFPELSLNFSYGSGGNNIKDSFDNFNESIGISFKYTLINWGKIRNNYNKKKNEIDYKKIEIEKIKADTEIELTEKYNEILKIDKLIKIYKKRVELAKHSFEIENVKYEKKLTNVTDFLNVENEFMESEINLLNQIAEKYIKVYDYVTYNK